MMVRDLLPYPWPYAGLVGTEVRAPGWDSEHPVFREMLTEHRPRLIVEVGSWLGGSALTMARIGQELGLDYEIVCVDTWLGSTGVEMPEEIEWEHGRPALLERFLENVLAAQFDNVISPFVQTSSNAARWFREQGIRPDLVYVDGGHEEGEVQLDIEVWSPLCRTMFGHDYSDNYPGVKAAVDAAFPDADLSRPPFWIRRGS